MITSKVVNKRERIKFTDLSKAKNLSPSDLFNEDSTLSYSVEDVESAIETKDKNSMRSISNYFFRRGGIYTNLIEYKYNLINPEYIISPTTKELEMEDIYEGLEYLDKFSLNIQYVEILKDILKEGVSFRYYTEKDNAITLQELPVSYCRTRFQANNLGTVEFDAQYFDREFTDANKREQILKFYPKEVQDAYKDYKNGNIKREDGGYWVLLDIEKAVAFTLNGDDTPPYMSVIVDIINLNDEKILNKRRLQQELKKLLVQTVPTDKEGNFLLSTQEVKSLHKFAKDIMSDNVDVDVLTTMAETEVKDVQESAKVKQETIDMTEQSIFTEAGVSSSLFNSDSNTTQKSSIIGDINSLNYFINSLETFINRKLKQNVNEELSFKLVPVCEHTKQDEYKRALEGATYGMPTKMYTALLNGVKQQEFLEWLHFENEMMNLNEIMEPLKSSHTQSGNDEGGREPKDVTEVADKTLENNNAKGGSE